MILNIIAESTKKRVERAKAEVPPEEIKRRAMNMPKGDFPFEKALRNRDFAFICEIKRASPSRGIIAEDFPYLDIAREYEKAGAAAISVLTEPEFFMGSIDYLREIRTITRLPLLRKDFVLDPYQIYEAKAAGADAALLICALLDPETLREYIGLCHELGLSALVEAHNVREAETALSAGARILGANNRDLRTFDVDIGVCAGLRLLAPPEVIFVAESGIKTPGDIDFLRGNGIRAALIGETLMKSPDKKAALDLLRKGGAS